MAGRDELVEDGDEPSIVDRNNRSKEKRAIALEAVCAIGARPWGRLVSSPQYGSLTAAPRCIVADKAA